MKIRIRLYASLRKYTTFPKEIRLKEKATLNDLYQALQLFPSEAKITFVNSVARDPSFKLKDGDEVGIFPPVGGG